MEIVTLKPSVKNFRKDKSTMKIAVLSDIHGNAVALEAVLKDLKRQGDVDLIIVPGDLYVFCSAPNEVFDILQQLPHTRFLLGNTDRYLLEENYPSTPGSESWQDTLLLSFRWTAEHLTPQAFQFLKTLPPVQVIRQGDQQLLAVHGSPRSDEEGLTVETAAEDLQGMSVDPQVSIIIGGHTHLPMDRLIGHTRVINAGSIGLPFDGDPRASYVIISNLAEGASARIKIRRVVYDIEKSVEQLYATRHPAADIGAYNLRTARSIGSDLIYTTAMRHHHSSPPY
jgi:putative phosphoesterase